MGHRVLQDEALEADLESGGGKPIEFLKAEADEKLEAEEDRNGKEKCFETEKASRTKGNKKVAKPPRHPRGPFLDAADQRFIEELVLKRVKTERLKELKRLDASATPSSSFYLLVIIILGLLILILIQMVKLYA